LLLIVSGGIAGSSFLFLLLLTLPLNFTKLQHLSAGEFKTGLKNNQQYEKCIFK